MIPPEDEPDNPFEDAPWRGVAEMLAEQGFTVVPSANVSKYELRGRLWELVYALAGKRIFFFHTDHLSDREFYNWLENSCLPSKAADLPPSSEWSSHVDVSESGTNSISPEKLALRYYADASARANWQAEHPGQAMPAHQPLPFHRDLQLPRPHAPITKPWPFPGFVSELDELESESVEDSSSETMDFQFQNGADDEEFDEDNDPLGLAAVDREIHRQGNMDSDDGEDEDYSPIYITPAETGLDFDASEQTFLRPIDILRQRSYSPLPMAELTEETVAPALWELLHELSSMNFFIVHTDHLSDAELYLELTRNVIYQQVIIPELMETVACYHDCLHHGAKEAIRLWLKYYATVQQRQEWRAAHPQAELPASEDLPYQRDWHLPQLPVRP